jgi:peptidoglycan/LPS O-acetylase OafA/YrhL
MEYRKEIDGLRALAVLPVILFHAGFSWFSGGYVGVDVFFVISGYLITSILLKDLALEQFSFFNFYERRARRILPALFFVLICSMPFAWYLLTAEQFRDYSQALIAITLFSSNILFWLKSGYFSPASEENPLLHTWSLGVEEQFYLIFPVILLLAWRFGKKPTLHFVLFLSLASFLLAEWGWRNHPTPNFYLLPTRAWEIGAGVICALILHDKKVLPNSPLSFTGLMLIVFSIFLYDSTTPFPSFYALAPVLGTCFIILFASKDVLTGKFLSEPLLVGIGLVSFSAYLWHQPLFAFARIISLNPLSPVFMGFLSASSIGLAFFSWKYIEKPFRGKQVASKGKLIYSFSLLGLILFASAGLWGIWTGGAEFRLSTNQLRWASELQEMRESRSEAIKASECHFSIDRDQERGVHRFLDDWNCIGAPTSNGGRVATYGDSHSADKAAALRALGIDPLQIGGSHCPIYPVEGMKDYCEPLFEKLMAASKSNNINTIVLSNRFQGVELDESYLLEAINFWSDNFERVILFTPMPEFFRFDTIYASSGSKAEDLKPTLDNHAIFETSISNIRIPNNVMILDTVDVFCGDIIQKCRPIQNNTSMLIDYGHLSPEGARIFGKRLSYRLDF